METKVGQVEEGRTVRLKPCCFDIFEKTLFVADRNILYYFYFILFSATLLDGDAMQCNTTDKLRFSLFNLKTIINDTVDDLCSSEEGATLRL
jgi:hypothetical protein